VRQLIDPSIFLDLLKGIINLGACLSIPVASTVTIRNWVGGWGMVLRRTYTPGQPRPGEIWWADVPYADGSGSKIRPCLVIRVHPRFLVLKITSKKGGRRAVRTAIPTDAWDPRASSNSFLDLSRAIPVTDDAFVRKAGNADSGTWRLSLPHRLGLR